MTVTVRHRQTLTDIAIQVYGDVRGVIALSAANNISVTDPLTPGMTLLCPEEVYDRYMQDWVTKRKIIPATESEPDDEVRTNVFTKVFTEEFA